MTKARDWFCVAVASCCLFTVQGYNRVRGLMYLELIDLYNRGPFLTSWITSAPAISRVISGCMTGFLLERISPTKLLCLGSLLMTMCFVGTAFAPNLETVVALFAGLQGFAAPVVITVVYIFVNRRIHKLRQRANAVMFIGVSLLSIVFPYLVQILLETFSSRGTWIIFGGLSLQACVLAAILRAVPPGNSDNLDDTETGSTKINKAIKDDESKTNANIRRKHDNEDEFPEDGPSDTTMYKTKKKIQNVIPETQQKIGKRDKPLQDQGKVSFKTETVESEISAVTAENPTNNENPVSQGFTRKEERETVWTKLKSNKFLRLFTNRKFLTAVIWFGCLKTNFQFVTQFAPAFGEELGMTNTERSTLISVYSGGEFTMRVFLAVFGDSTWLKKDAFISICGITAGTISLLVTVYSRPWIISSFCFVSGLLGDSMTVFIGSLVVESVGVSNLDMAMGILPATLGIVTLIAPLVGGYLRETYGTYRYAILGAGVSSFASFGVFAILGDRISSPLRYPRKSAVYVVT